MLRAPTRPRPHPRPLAAMLAVFLAALLLFGWNVARPTTPYFDEVHYLPAARAMVAGTLPGNTEHPPLGKLLIAGGIAAFGDTATGWRAASVVAGGVSVAGVFAILWLLYGRIRTALFGSALAAANITLFVHARIAMLEPFLGAFVLAGIAALLWAMRGPPGRARWRWALGAAALGAATAVKWTAAPYVAFAAVAFWFLKRGRPDRWPGVSRIGGVATLGAVSVATYALAFVPAMLRAEQPLAPAGLLRLQWEMYAQQTQVLSPHPYQSDWWSWPPMLRPVWYLYEYVDGAQRGVLLLGNPAVAWGGLVAVAWLGWRWWRDYDTRGGAIALLWAASLGMWAAIPKSLGVFYYYHLSMLFLAIAIAAAFDAWRPRAAVIYGAVAFGCFAWFYPIISASVLENAGSFARWTWFPGWR